METQDKVVLLRTFDTLPEAQYAKDMLEQNGVLCSLDNQAISQLYPLYGSSVSGIRLMVLAGDLDKAEDILRDAYIV